jgi:hypothetical protein
MKALLLASPFPCILLKEKGQEKEKHFPGKGEKTMEVVRAELILPFNCCMISRESHFKFFKPLFLS